MSLNYFSQDDINKINDSVNAKKELSAKAERERQSWKEHLIDSVNIGVDILTELALEFPEFAQKCHFEPSYVFLYPDEHSRIEHSEKLYLILGEFKSVGWTWGNCIMIRPNKELVILKTSTYNYGDEEARKYKMEETDCEALRDTILCAFSKLNSESDGFPANVFDFDNSFTIPFLKFICNVSEGYYGYDKKFRIKNFKTKDEIEQSIKSYFVELPLSKKWGYSEDEMNSELENREKWNNYYRQSQKKGCYIATAVYGSYDCPQVWTLRRYRDIVLSRSWYGRAFIRTYYCISPILVKIFGGTDFFNRFWKKRLDILVNWLNDNGIHDAPYSDS